MGTWNYRVILKDGQYAIHEVYYNDQGEAWTCTEDPVGPAGDTLAELAEGLEHYRQALERPVLAFEDFPNKKAAPAALARDATGELIVLEDLKTECEGAKGPETGEPST